MTRRPPKVGLRGPGPHRNQVDLPPPSELVEAEKIDPRELLERGLKRSTLSKAEQDLMDNATPIEAPAAPSAPKVEAAKEPKEETTYLPPPEEKSPTDAIGNSLIDRLSARFGLTAPQTKDVILEAAGVQVKVTIRKPFYDDYIWTVGVIEGMLDSNEDVTLIRGEAQRSQFLEHLSACRCVIKLEDEYIWDAFPYRDMILATRPNWDGTSHAVVPDHLLGGMAQSLHSLFRRLHPDLLFDLARAVKNSWGMTAGDDEVEEEADDADPTEAA